MMLDVQVILQKLAHVQVLKSVWYITTVKKKQVVQLLLKQSVVTKSAIIWYTFRGSVYWDCSEFINYKKAPWNVSIYASLGHSN